MSNLPTGLTGLDEATGGGAPGSLWMVGGPEGTPASLLALTAARATTLLAKGSVAWLSTQESPASLRESVVCAEARCPYGMSPDEYQDLAEVGAHGTEVDEPDNIDAHLRMVRAECQERIEAAVAALAAARLRSIRVSPEDILAGALDLLRTQPVDLMVLDHLVLASLDADDLANLQRGADESQTWVVLVADSLRDPRPLRAVTTENVDVVVIATHPDLHDPDSPFAGEAHLTVYQQGQRARKEVVAFQDRFRRYVNGWVHPPYQGMEAVSAGP